MLTRRALLGHCVGIAAATLSAVATAQPTTAFDHSYSAWDALLKKHVRWMPDNKQSRVDYGMLVASRTALKKILDEWSAVPASSFAAFSREQQMAFLINAYNGFTLELILGKYPDLKSIKELATWFRAHGRRSSSSCWTGSATWTGSNMSNCGRNMPTRASTPP